MEEKRVDDEDEGGEVVAVANHGTLRPDPAPLYKMDRLVPCKFDSDTLWDGVVFA